MSNDCSATLGAGADLAAALEAAGDGAVVCLDAGTYAVNLVLTKSVTLRARGEVILDGDRRGGVVAVRGDDLTVRLEGLVLTNGSAPQGGAVALEGMSKVALVGCTLRGNTGRQGPGGAVFADQGSVSIQRCRLEDNAAPDGAGVCVDGIASLRLEDSLVVGEGKPGKSVVRVRDGADAVILRSTVVGLGASVALHVSGTTSRQPEVAVSDSVLAPGFDEATAERGNVRVERSFVGAVPGFAGGGEEPYALTTGSPACGIAHGGGVDLRGRERPASGACAGAFER